MNRWRLIYGGRHASEVLFSLHCNALMHVWKHPKAHYGREGRKAPSFPMFLKHIGLSLAMTLVKLPRERDYWYGALLRGACRLPIFCDVMPYRKFIEIASMLRSALPADKDRADGSWKANILFCVYFMSKSLIVIIQLLYYPPLASVRP